MKQETILLYTDGAALGNPGPGGWGVVLKCGSYYKELSGGEAFTTNNRMELTAVIEGLKAIKWELAKVKVFSDSTYVVNAVNKGWLEGWAASNFKKKKNVDLWRKFLEVYKEHDVTMRWIEGHAGQPENERCDTLATEAAKEYAKSTDSIKNNEQ